MHSGAMTLPPPVADHPRVIVAVPAFVQPLDDTLFWRGPVHDINNKLTAVLGFCDLLDAAGAADPSKRARYAASIRAAAKSCAAIAAAMLRPRGAAVADPAALPPVDLHQVLADELGQLSGDYLRAGVNLHLERDARRAFVRVDPTELGRVLVNLCDNARDALVSHALFKGPRHPRILVATADAAPADGGQVVLTVGDNGPGIPDEFHDQVWQEGYSTKRPVPGSRRGFGLAVVRRCVETVGGRVELESVAGQGTTFRLYLPAA